MHDHRHIALQLKAFCLFATHFHELTDLEQETASGIGNLHMAVQSGDQGVLMMYEVRRGVSSQSYGMSTAEAAAFPPEAIRVSAFRLVTGTLFYSPSAPDAADGRGQAARPAGPRRRR